MDTPEKKKAKDVVKNTGIKSGKVSHGFIVKDKDGKEVVIDKSVTGIIGCAMVWGLLYFYGKYGTQKAKEISTEATEIGKGLAHFIEDYRRLKGKINPAIVAPKIRIPVDNFIAFDKKYKPQVLWTEKQVYHLGLMYGGTIDEVWVTCNEMAGYKIIITDWKSSKALHAQNKIQVEAYARALQWMAANGMIKVDGEVNEGIVEALKDLNNYKLWVVNISKSEKMDFNKLGLDDFCYLIEPNEIRWNAFLGLAKYFEWEKTHKEI